MSRACKGKGKVPPGYHSAEVVIQVTGFSGPPIPNLGIMSLSFLIASRSGCVVRVLALPSGGSRFEPRSLQLVKAIGGISGPCKIVYDQRYKNRQKSVSFSEHISDRLSVVLIRAEPHKGYVTERVRSSAA